MVVTCLLSIYLLNHFDNVYIKLCLALISISEVLDIIWLFMYAGLKWNPPEVGNNASYQTQYLRFIVFFTVVIIIIKVKLDLFRFLLPISCTALRTLMRLNTRYQWDYLK